MRFLSSIAFLISSIMAYGQNPLKPAKNLVPNGSFENCRKPINNLRMAIPWKPMASVDYYHKPVEKDTTAHKGAYDGNAYCGLRFQKKYKEFMEVKLVESLHRGTIYEVSMQVRLAYWSNATLKSFGFLLSKGGYHKQADAVRGNMVDTMAKKKGLMQGFQWFTVRGYYKADGGEKYLTLGNFAPDVKKDMMRMNILKMGFKEAYYFIDDVNLKVHKEDKEEVEVVIVGPTIKEEDSTLVVKNDIQVGEKVALKNIIFDHGKYYLLPESYVELNKLVKYLMKNPSIQIQINGHSDNSGLNFKNQKMSELRAREVFEYLIKKGVQNRMYFKGFGSSQPVASNDTDEGKALNRRVEFEIIKK
ncbi:MAG: OmpA family protein [Sphingobacteriaceae bacterium]|nr:OmpA family protein [Sphingobacteriaceae bacterium]